jgi:hypothetical protein
MTAPYPEAVALVFSLFVLLGAGAFFWSEKKVAGFAFLVAFIVSFSAVLGQRVVLSSAIVGVTVEKSVPDRTANGSR